MAKFIRNDGTFTGKSLVGLVFGKLTVIKLAGFHLYEDGSRREPSWFCKCECGRYSIVRADPLKKGGTKTCGCGSSRNSMGDRMRTHGEASAAKRTALYRRWSDMWSRCTNPNASRWAEYGGRGIRVCEEWRSYEKYKEDMGSTFSPELSIERIDVNGNYCKENCRWATRKEQMQNTRRNRFFTFRGETKTLAEWCEIQGLDYYMVWKRLRRKWTPERALGFT